MTNHNNSKEQLLEKISSQAKKISDLENIIHQFKEQTEKNTINYKLAHKRQAIILNLTLNNTLASGDLEKAAKIITRASSEALKVSRSSIWMLDEKKTQIKCLDLFEDTTQKHSSGHILHAEQYPNYFTALMEGRTIDAHDARRDPRTSEFSKDYLIPTGITSMLDSAIRVAGQVMGVVCHEHVGEKRIWTIEETSFSGEISDQIAQAVLNQERDKITKSLKKNLQELEDFKKAALGREHKMIELKKEVNQLSKKLGKPQPYDLSFLDQ